MPLTFYLLMQVIYVISSCTDPNMQDIHIIFQ